MGSRTNYQLKDAKGSIWLYSHWGGDDKSLHFAEALEHARPRWGDVSYAIRMVVSSLIGADWKSETGFGLGSWEFGEENYDPLTADFVSNTVEHEGETYTFDEFIKRYG
jgi:hypothetical protein